MIFLVSHSDTGSCERRCTFRVEISQFPQLADVKAGLIYVYAKFKDYVLYLVPQNVREFARIFERAQSRSRRIGFNGFALPYAPIARSLTPSRKRRCSLTAKPNRSGASRRRRLSRWNRIATDSSLTASRSASRLDNFARSMSKWPPTVSHCWRTAGHSKRGGSRNSPRSKNIRGRAGPVLQRVAYTGRMETLSCRSLTRQQEITVILQN